MKFKKIFASGAFIFLILAIVLMYMVLPKFADPNFTVVNKTQEPVKVTAYWRNNVKDLGFIQPASEYKFIVNDEAGMRFVGTFSGDSVIESNEIYFTAGSVVIAEVYDDKIKLDYSDDNLRTIKNY